MATQSVISVSCYTVEAYKKDESLCRIRGVKSGYGGLAIRLW